MEQINAKSHLDLIKESADKSVKEWTKSRLLDGLEGQEKRNMAVLLNNQYIQVIQEAKRENIKNGGNGQILNEASAGSGTATFQTGTGPQWAGVALPLVRKVFGQISCKEFVSVQPMSMPNGVVFYIDFQYGSNQPGYKTGGFPSSSVYGYQSVQEESGFGNTNRGGLYGNRAGYTINYVSSSVGVTVASSSLFDINFDTTFAKGVSVASGSNTIPGLWTVSVSANTINSLSGSAGIDLRSIAAFSLSGSGITYDNTINQFNTYVSNPAAANYGGIQFVVANPTDPTGTGTGTATLFYKLLTDFNVRGDFEQPYGFPSYPITSQSIAIPEININLASEKIDAETRKLKATWTMEFMQDLNAYQGLDAEVEVTAIMSEYMSLEIDLDVINMLNDAVLPSQKTIWSAVIGNEYNGQGIVSNTAGAFYDKMSWFQTFGIKVNKLSNIIHQKTLRGGANFMIISPAVATILESIPGFAADNTEASTMKYSFGPQKIGSLSAKYKVFKNPYFNSNQVLLGFRGNQFLECGAVYAPYIPMITTGIVIDPVTFTPNKAISTRYAKKMIRPEYYASIYVSGLEYV